MAADGEQQPDKEYGGHTGKEWGQLVMDSGVIGSDPNTLFCRRLASHGACSF